MRAYFLGNTKKIINASVLVLDIYTKLLHSLHIFNMRHRLSYKKITCELAHTVYTNQSALGFRGIEKKKVNVSLKTTMECEKDHE